MKCPALHCIWTVPYEVLPEWSVGTTVLGQGESGSRSSRPHYSTVRIKRKLQYTHCTVHFTDDSWQNKTPCTVNFTHFKCSPSYYTELVKQTYFQATLAATVFRFRVAKHRPRWDKLSVLAARGLSTIHFSDKRWTLHYGVVKGK